MSLPLSVTTPNFHSLLIVIVVVHVAKELPEKLLVAKLVGTASTLVQVEK